MTCSPCVPTSVKKADRKALRWGGALVDQVVELVQLQAQEHRPEQAGDGQPQQGAIHILLLLAQHGKAEGDGRQQQEGRVDGHQRQVETAARRGACRVAAAQHAIGGKQGGKDEAVAHQVQPEAQGVPFSGWGSCARWYSRGPGACGGASVKAKFRHGGPVGVRASSGGLHRRPGCRSHA